MMMDDRIRLLDAIDLWKCIAAEQIDDIGCWRQTTDDYAQTLEDGDIPDPMSSLIYDRLISGCGWDEPPKFYEDTTHLVRRITVEYPKLDPTPLQEIYAAVTAWYHDHNARRIPDQSVLMATLEKAMMTLQAIQADIERELVSSRNRLEPTELQSDILSVFNDDEELSPAEVNNKLRTANLIHDESAVRSQMRNMIPKFLSQAKPRGPYRKA